ncbi:MAG: flavodoxin family protein [Acetivibrionales bacterium]
MKVLILCDRESVTDRGFNLGLRSEEILKQVGCEVQRIVLSSDEIKSCIGCFGCWVKTPGLCVITNDCANDISRELMRSDAVVLLTRITYGGFSPDSKAFLDRSIQNVLPYFEIYRDEMRHKMRYGRFPWWIAVGYGDSSEGELEIFRGLSERNALNLRPQKHFCLMARSADECQDVLQMLKRIFTEEVSA